MTYPPVIPWFADGGDSDPERRMAAFEAYARWFFRENPLWLTRHLTADEWADLQRSIILHCVTDNFRALKQFRSAGGNFDAWFCTVCMNQIRDHLKSRNRYREVIQLLPEPAGESDAVSGHDPEETARLRRLTGEVNRGIAELDRYCRVLVRLAGEEFRPREMVRVLRWPPAKAKKVSDDLKYCKEKLRKWLAERGITDI